MTTKQVYINLKEVLNIDLPVFIPPNCNIDTVKLSEGNSLFASYQSRNAGIYWRYYKNYYNARGDTLKGIVFTSRHCVKCISSGASNIPPED